MTNAAITKNAQPAAVRPKTFVFPGSVEWLAGRMVSARVEGKQHIAVAPPIEFGGSDPMVWSPEDLVVSAVETCLAVTYLGLAQRRGLHVSCLRIDGEGVVGQRDDGRHGFTAMNLRLHVVVPVAELAIARKLAHDAHERCLVASSLAFPVDVEFDVHTAGG